MIGDLHQVSGYIIPCQFTPHYYRFSDDTLQDIGTFFIVLEVEITDASGRTSLTFTKVLTTRGIRFISSDDFCDSELVL